MRQQTCIAPHPRVSPPHRCRLSCHSDLTGDLREKVTRAPYENLARPHLLDQSATATEELKIIIWGFCQQKRKGGGWKADFPNLRWVYTVMSLISTHTPSFWTHSNSCVSAYSSHSCIKCLSAISAAHLYPPLHVWLQVRRRLFKKQTLNGRFQMVFFTQEANRLCSIGMYLPSWFSFLTHCCCFFVKAQSWSAGLLEGARDGYSCCLPFPAGCCSASASQENLCAFGVAYAYMALCIRAPWTLSYWHILMVFGVVFLFLFCRKTL